MKEVKNSAMMTIAAETLTLLKMLTFIKGGRLVLVSRYSCQTMKNASRMTKTTIRTGIYAVDQPTTLPWVIAKRRASSATVTRVPPSQSIEAFVCF